MKFQPYWKISYWAEAFLLGAGNWGTVRLLFGLFIGFFFWLLGSWIAGQTAAEAAYQSLVAGFAPLERLPGLGVRLFLGLFTWEAARFMLAPLAAFTGALLTGARYVQDVYELPSFSQGLQYIVASLFGFGYPSLTISDGRPQIKSGEINLIDKIGGPGYVNIRPGNVVLFEALTHPSSVRTAGNHQFISRFERIKEIINLEDHSGVVDNIQCVSKDGIEVQVLDVHFRYRLWPRFRDAGNWARSLRDPYPYSVKMVTNLVYNRTVNDRGMTTWHDAVKTIVTSAVTDYIQERQVDQVTAPRYTDGDPRTTIAKNITGSGVRSRLRAIGTALLWFDVGSFKANVDDSEFMKAWEARWIGKADVLRAHGEAQRLAYQELGRAEAQAEMLMGILHALDEVNPAGDSSANLQNIFLARTAQLLDSLNDAFEKEKRDGKHPLLPGSTGAPT